MSSGCRAAISSTSWRARVGGRARDPADDVANVAVAKRALLLSLNRHRLRREDLEDCFSQATLELIAQVRTGRGFANPRHVANALEVRFNSRISDRRRALSGRSPIEAAIETAATLADGDDGISIVDRRADVERVVIAREEVRRVGDAARELTPDQRVALGGQLASNEMSAAEVCAAHGWTIDKYRKVSQRARARLARLTERPEHVPHSRHASVEQTGTAYDHRRVDP